jgi:hypothetical protein
MIVSLAAQVAGIYHTRHHHHATVTYRGAAGVRDVGITLTPWRLPLLHLPVIDTPAQKAWVEWLGSSAPPSLVQCPWVIYLGQGSSSAVFVLPGQTVTLPASDVIVHVGQVNPGSTSTPEGCWK